MINTCYERSKKRKEVRGILLRREVVDVQGETAKICFQDLLATIKGKVKFMRTNVHASRRSQLLPPLSSSPASVACTISSVTLECI